MYHDLRMRILHVIPSMDPKQGGPPVVAARLAAAQAALGHAVEIIHYALPEAVERTGKSLAGVPGMERVRLHDIAPEGGAIAQIRALNLKRWITQHMSGCDYLHLHGVWNPILPITAKAARARQIPYCVVPHGMLDPWCLTGQGFAKAMKKRIALAISYRSMLDHAAFIHTLNRDEARLMEPLGLRPPAEVLPNGVFLDEMSPLPALGAFLGKHPELGSDPYVLFLSRLHFKKGLDFLADAFAMLRDRFPTLRLVIAGPDDGMVAPLTEQIGRLGIADRVHLVGSLYGQDKLAAFVDSACFCLPSRQEGFSMAITEALACGRPVVISDQCHFPEVAEAGAGEVTPCGSAPTAEALARVLSLSDAARAEMGRKGRELVETRYTWPRIAERTLEIYARRR